MTAVAIIAGLVCLAVGYWAGVWHARDEARDQLAALDEQLTRLKFENTMLRKAGLGRAVIMRLPLKFAGNDKQVTNN